MIVFHQHEQMKQSKKDERSPLILVHSDQNRKAKRQTAGKKMRCEQRTLLGSFQSQNLGIKTNVGLYSNLSNERESKSSRVFTKILKAVLIRKKMEHVNLKKRRLLKISRFAGQAFQFKEKASAYGPMAWVSCGTLILFLPALTQDPWVACASISLFALLSFIAFFDAMYFIVPDRCLVVAAMIGLAQILPQGIEVSIQALLAAFTGYAMIRIIMTGYKMLRGEPGMGQGDAKLFCVAGLWTGIEGLAGCLLYAVVSAFISILIMQYKGAKLNARSAIPFGPHLAFGFWLVWSVGPLILLPT